MQPVGRVIAVIGALLCGGCSSLNQSMRPIPLAEYPLADARGINVDTGQMVNLTSAFSSTDVPIISEDLLKNAMKNSEYRDWLQDALLQRSDVLCGRYVDYLYNMVTLRKFGLNELTTIANAVGTLSTTQSVTRAMTFIGTVSSGTSGNFDSEILQSQLITLIVTQIKRNREQILGLIMDARRNAPREPYSVSLSIRDAERYHQQCSFIAAMSGLTEAAQKPSPSSQPQSNAAVANAANAEAANAQAAAVTGSAPPAGGKSGGR